MTGKPSIIYHVRCQLCGTPVESKSPHRKYCDKDGRLVQNKRHRENAQPQSSAPTREYKLLCGHSVLFRHPPILGKHLWCERCDDWILYAPTREALEAAVDRCRKGHERTLSNTYIDPQGRRNCLECRKENRGRKKEKSQ